MFREEERQRDQKVTHSTEAGKERYRIHPCIRRVSHSEVEVESLEEEHHPSR